MNTEERIKEIIESLDIDNVVGDKDILKLQLELLVLQAQLEQLQKEK